MNRPGVSGFYVNGGRLYFITGKDRGLCRLKAYTLEFTPFGRITGTTEVTPDGLRAMRPLKDRAEAEQFLTEQFRLMYGPDLDEMEKNRGGQP